jgi:iron complex outermembrane receptor protein
VVIREPVTAVSTPELAKVAPESIPQALEQLPQFSATTGTNSNNNQGGIPNAGNYLNLRGLGTLENLVLLNGQRLPPTSYNGSVDTNIIPQGLISRVDVVTGGASAAYGSDAVSGVVNFILDTKFDGLKGEVQGGTSNSGDDDSLKVELVGGMHFDNGRGHIEFSYDHFDQPGLYNSDRPLGNSLITEVGAGTAANPYHPASNVHIANGAFGTLIEGGATAASCGATPDTCKFSPWALTNTTFTPTGQNIPFNPGTTTGFSNYNIGGDGGYTFGSTLTASQDTDQYFARTDYDFTSSLHGFAQMGFVQSLNTYTTVADGTQLSSFQIYADNAFLPTSVSQAMNAAGIQSFEGSRIEADQSPKLVDTLNDVYTVLAGLNGDLGQDYHWSLTYSYGDSLLRAKQYGNFNQERWLASLDAVRGPGGNIVCAVTITHPGLMDNCVPYDIFGNGAPSPAAYKYIEAASQYQTHNTQHDVALQFNGKAFELPAGPVNFAVGGEFRSASLDETSNTNPAQGISLTGLTTYVNPFLLQYNSTNVGPSTGSEQVEEGFVEVAVPVLRDLPFAKALDVNAAARYTNYSVSGPATTWKFGVSYTPVEEFRFRATDSQDIRAPTLYELFAGRSATRGIINDPLTGLSDNALTFTEGNAKLKPEIAHTYTIGGIWQPHYIPGFSASVDYFNIEIDDKVVQLSSAQILSDCTLSGGTSPECSFIDRPINQTSTSALNFPVSIDSVSFNQASTQLYGLDYEVNYHLPMNHVVSSWEGRTDFRLVGNWTPSYKVNNGPGQPTYQEAGVVGAITGSPGSATSPVAINKFMASAASYNGPFNVGIDMRFIGRMVETTVHSIHYANNDIPSVTYFDMNMSYDWKIGGHLYTTYLVVNNLLNKQPPLIPYGQPGEFYPTNQQLYDVVGRYMSGGVRFKF